MKYNWILDVLADLRTFAQVNELNDLAVQLDRTRLVAETEIASVSEIAGLITHADDKPSGSYSGGIGARAQP